MSLDVKNAGAQITLAEGAAMTAKYRASNPNKTKAHLIGMNRIHEILDQEGCEGIRIYYGLNDEGDQELVLVGVDRLGDDMEKGVIMDKLLPCPSYCPNANPLNA